VDASKADSLYFKKLDKETLPDSLKNKTTDQLQQIVNKKQGKRRNTTGDIDRECQPQ